MLNYMCNFNFNIINRQTTIIAPVPDQKIGIIINNKFIVDTQRANIDYNCNISVNNRLNNPIVIVLESPHTCEYDSITGAALGPAMGKTGSNIKKHLQTLLINSNKSKNIKDHDNYDVILMNAVQYQFSLGKTLNNNKHNKSIRDTNFRNCLCTFGKGCDFLNRLSAIKPFLIINLCTKGLSNLQDCVEKHISIFKCLYPNTLSTRGSHPCTWFYIKNAKIEDF